VTAKKIIDKEFYKAWEQKYNEANLRTDLKS
jgi:hypothetical protein